MTRRFVITGAPGAGKTTLLRALQRSGLVVAEEAATDVIAREQARGIDEPWRSRAFIDDIVALQRKRQLAAVGDIQVFDRSPVCTLALCRWLGFAPTPALEEELGRLVRDQVYDPRVLFVETIGFIEPTAARRISFEESVQFERLHREAYQALGYDLVSIPPGPVEARVALILSAIG